MGLTNILHASRWAPRRERGWGGGGELYRLRLILKFKKNIAFGHIPPIIRHTREKKDKYFIPPIHSKKKFHPGKLFAKKKTAVWLIIDGFTGPKILGGGRTKKKRAE